MKPCLGRWHCPRGGWSVPEAREKLAEHPGPRALVCPQQNHKPHSAALRALIQTLSNL